MTGTARSNDLARGLPVLSRSILATRLRHLERAGVMARDVRRVLHLRFADDVRRLWIGSLYAVWLGEVPLAGALRTGRVQVEGPTTVTRRLDQILRLSQITPIVSAAL